MLFISPVAVLSFFLFRPSLPSHTLYRTLRSPLLPLLSFSPRPHFDVCLLSSSILLSLCSFSHIPTSFHFNPPRFSPTPPLFFFLPPVSFTLLRPHIPFSPPSFSPSPIPSPASPHLPSFLPYPTLPPSLPLPLPCLPFFLPHPSFPLPNPPPSFPSASLHFTSLDFFGAGNHHVLGPCVSRGRFSSHSRLAVMGKTLSRMGHAGLEITASFQHLLFDRVAFHGESRSLESPTNLRLHHQCCGEVRVLCSGQQFRSYKKK